MKAKRVRLISGPKWGDYSYYHGDTGGLNPDELGRIALGIWNHKVSSVRQRFSHCRTVVLVKSKNLLECALFELESVCYDTDQYTWKWNANKNLEGHDEYGQHRFTWQPHGAQFTIVEDVPPERLAFQLRAPERLPRETALKALNFDESWVTLL
ncbi:MAG: hypothetical protein M3Y56_04440 [Armatimonadota bacterium]|nr:hypothetical protein [Armatimonadota bacterium]